MLLYGRLLESDYFRNYIPFAPNLEVDALTAEPFEIPMREWILQGARDAEEYYSPEPEVLSRIPVQRGWRMRVIITEEPRHGVVTWDPNKASFVYTSHIGFEGEDCFTYVFTNGYQKSLMAKVIINITRTYGVDINRIVENEDGTYGIFLDPFIPPGQPNPLWIRYDWYYRNYQQERVRDDGTTGIYPTDYRFYYTIYHTKPNGYPTTKPDSQHPRNRVARNLPSFTPATDTNLQGFIRDGDVPYRPTGQSYQIYIIVRMYFNHKKKTVFGGYRNGKPYYYQVNDGLDYSKYTTIKLEIKDYYSHPWWESGNIERPSST